MGDWLWDGSGEPDEAERRLQEALRPLDQEPPMPELPARRRRWPLALGVLAAAAALLFALRGGDAWPVHATAGPCASGACQLGEGDTLVAGPGERLFVRVHNHGTIEIFEDSSLLREPDADGHRLRLERGGLHLQWKGPAGGVRVETPAASVIDLGCAYALTVDDRGTALRVEDGTILLMNERGKAYVTGGSAASVAPGAAPGLPVREDAPAPLREAIRGLEGASPTAAHLDAALALARPEDLLTLWNLMERVGEPEQRRIYATMRGHVPSLPAEPGPGLMEGPARTALWQALVPVALP